MLNRSASLAMSTSVLKTLPGKLDIKRHSPSIHYITDSSVPTEQATQTFYIYKVFGITWLGFKPPMARKTAFQNFFLMLSAKFYVLLPQPFVSKAHKFHKILMLIKIMLFHEDATEILSLIFYLISYL